MKRRLQSLLFGAFPIIVIIIGWEFVSRAGVITILLSSPIKVAESFYNLLTTTTSSGYPIIIVHTAYSIYELTVGFVIALVVGITLGSIAGMRNRIYAFLEPIITVFMPIPGIAWGPILLIWFGFGSSTIIAVTVIVAFFPIFYNTASGFRDVEINLIRAAQIMGANKSTIFFKVMLPGAAAHIFTGIKLGIAKGWRTVIAVEMIASSLWGLGYMIFDARDYLQPSVIYSGIIMLIIVYYLIENLLLRQIEKRTVIKWGMVQEGAL